MALRNPSTRIHLVNLVTMLADPGRQRRDWIAGRPGWEAWADEFHDDVNDGYMAVEGSDGAVDPHDAIGDTLHDAREADVLIPLFAVLGLVIRDGRDRPLPSREAAARALDHPLWPDVIRAATAAREILDEPLR